MDTIVRATAADAQIRAFVANTKELVQTAYEKHNTSPVVTAALGRSLTAGAIMGMMQKGEKDLLTIKIAGDGPVGSITVTADSQGQVKGYAENPLVDIPLKPNGKLDVSGAIGNGMLTVIKDIGLREPYSGQIPLQTGEIAEDFTYYFTASEQVPSAVGLGVLVDRDYSVKQAGGFIVQLMPFASEEVISRLEENLSKISSVTKMLDDGLSNKQILELLLDGLSVEIMEETTPSFACNCGNGRIERALITLGKKELGKMIADKEPIEVHCDFCNTSYTYSVEELKKLYDKAK